MPARLRPTCGKPETVILRVGAGAGLIRAAQMCQLPRDHSRMASTSHHRCIGGRRPMVSTVSAKVVSWMLAPTLPAQRTWTDHCLRLLSAISAWHGGFDARGMGAAHRAQRRCAVDDCNGTGIFEFSSIGPMARFLAQSPIDQQRKENSVQRAARSSLVSKYRLLSPVSTRCYRSAFTTAS